MEIEIISHFSDNEKKETRNGIYVYDGRGNQYRIYLDNFGDLTINSVDGKLAIEPNVTNEIVVKTKQ